MAETEAPRARACLRCMNALVNGTAVSRTDNKTGLCSDCELGEAIEDLNGQLTPQENWKYAEMSRYYGIEPVGLSIANQKPEEVPRGHSDQ